MFATKVDNNFKNADLTEDKMTFSFKNKWTDFLFCSVMMGLGWHKVCRCLGHLYSSNIISGSMTNCNPTLTWLNQMYPSVSSTPRIALTLQLS